eukprot:TRINITY_DN74605_c0_g1_i1.p1 TRINITY_DN74605_c0_g1~~TRINITY_DN74605_c0_g1_i1.p1  ORF type:complete len:618 (-),score=70.13 TRINITY_DN74605_c0_g1_i1:210-2000(-)
MAAPTLTDPLLIPVPQHMLNFKRKVAETASIEHRASNSIPFRKNKKDLLRNLNAGTPGSRYYIPQDARRLVKGFLPAHRVGIDTLRAILEQRAVLARKMQHWIAETEVPDVTDSLARHRFHSVVSKLAVARPAFVQAYQNLLVQGASVSEISELMINLVDVLIGRSAVVESSRLPSVDGYSEMSQALVSVVSSVIKFDTYLESYHVDPIMATNQHTFSIFGPHNGDNYGDIALVFRADIMYHPDFNMTPNAATAFYSKSTLDFRPWAFDIGTSQEDRIYRFHRSKIHPSSLDWDLAVAGELVRMAENAGFMPSAQGILSYMKAVDCHFVWQCHLPEVVPLDYLAKVFIPSKYKKRLGHITNLVPSHMVVWVDGDPYDAMEKFFLSRMSLETNHLSFGSNPAPLTSFSFALFSPTVSKMRRAVVLPRRCHGDGFQLQFTMCTSASLRIMISDSPFLGEGMQIVPDVEWSDDILPSGRILIMQVNHAEMAGTITIRHAEIAEGDTLSNNVLLRPPQREGKKAHLPKIFDGFDFQTETPTSVSISGSLDPHTQRLTLEANVGDETRCARVNWRHGGIFEYVGFAAASASLVSLRNIIIS